MKKAMAAMMAATMMAGSLAGCGNNSSEEQENEKAGGENELRIMMSSGDCRPSGTDRRHYHKPDQTGGHSGTEKNLGKRGFYPGSGVCKWRLYVSGQ